ncbi:MAG: NAD(P)-dependent oxidoreductase [Candidatus Omnitrophica bacterium]|nr:NAD(P)-dependent oxidoreductase [Candidatus Omnitrophota bacterium]
MKVLITGGLGYIGGRLSRYILSSYPQAQLFLSTTRSSVPDWAKALPVFRLNLTDKDSIAKTLDNVVPDIVLHLAAMQQAECLRDPERAYRVNVDGTRNLLEAMGERGIKKMLYLSTFQIYGLLTGEITEQSPTCPQNAYAKTKMEGELVIQEKARQYNMDAVIVRLSNGYGCPADEQVASSVYTLAFNAFCRQILATGTIGVRSNQYRNFITLEDIAAAICFLAFERQGKESTEIFNLGSDECLSIEEVALRVIRVYERMQEGIKAELTVNRSQETAGVWSPFQYNSQKIQALGLRLLNNYEAEIRQTLEFFKTHQV